MQEFSSISVSSYEAGSLADRLTEQAGDGWSVVAIVPTGSTITAYLSRDGDRASSTDSTPSVPITSAAPTEPGHDDHGSSDHDADDGPSIPATTTGTVTGHDSAAADPVSEAPGWASGAGGVGAAKGAEPVGSMPQAEGTPAASTPAESGGAAASAAPAGWYADPSSRFELRYWDGGQWTEHVSRSGQQYTDPPVA
ncbi:MAG: DUF2510 domain-containing protein [Ilumatobacteraceae bacterium]